MRTEAAPASTSAEPGSATLALPSWQSALQTAVRDPAELRLLLDLPPDATDSQVKSRYRALVAELHPDRLIAAGAEPPLIKAATAKLATINAAYEAIFAERVKGLAE